MKLNLSVFEGPLDLLLYLIKKNNLEISRVSLSEVTDQYLNYLDTMKELNIDLASDFLLMASELAYIKSKSLLPADPYAPDEEEEWDTADQLLAKLKLYQLYKSASLHLKERPLLSRDVFKRASVNAFLDLPLKTELKPAAPTSYKVEIFDLVKAFGEVLKRLPKEERKHHVDVERVSVTDRMYEILDSLDTSETLLFSDLFLPEAKKIDWVVSFLALLEMVRLKLAHVFQTEALGEIRLKKRIDTTGFYSKDELQKDVAYR